MSTEHPFERQRELARSLSAVAGDEKKTLEILKELQKLPKVTFPEGTAVYISDVFIEVLQQIKLPEN